MKARITDGNFGQMITSAFISISKKALLDHSKNVLFDISGGTATVTCFGEETSVKMCFTESDSAEAKFLVDFQTLSSFLSGKKGAVGFDVVEGGRLTVSAGASKLKTTWTDPSAYPSFPKMGSNSFPVDGGWFIPVLKKAFMFSDNDEFRPEISGVYLTAKDGKLEAVSTDKFIIYRYYKQIPDEIVFHILISGRCASMLDGLLGAGESVVSISTDGCSSFFNTAKASVFNRGTERAFPNYGRIFDSFDEAFSIRVGKGKLLGALSESQIASDDDCILYCKDNTLSISSMDEFSTKQIESVLEERAQCPDFRARLSTKRMKCAIKSLEGNETQLIYPNNGKMLKIKSDKEPNVEIILGTKVDY